MSVSTDRTTIALRPATRDRVRHHASQESKTVDAFLTQLMDAHEEHLFWQNMAQVTPGEYEEACREDGVWPGDYDFTTESTDD